MSFVRKNPSAGGIVYDNTTSGLAATTLQQAVDELAGFSPTISLKEQILSANDRTQTITKLNVGQCNERITQIQYQAVSVSPTASATKIFTYSATGYEYEISGITWLVIP